MHNCRLYAFRLMTGFNGGWTSLIIAPSRLRAIEIFCRMHALNPEQIAVMYSYPLAAFW